jgi:nucleoside-diphosphate-sugar epimerase
MKILVTGAGGFLGLGIAKALIKEGHKVFNFSRNDHKALKELNIETIKGNLKISADIEKAVIGMDAVFHVASMVGVWGDSDDFFTTNVLGTKNLIDACLKNNIKKIVYTSSPSVVFGNESLENADESQPYPNDDDYLCDYAKTKAQAEQLIIKANCSTLSTVSLRPHLIFGPGDTNLFPRILNKARKGKLKKVGNGENIVDVIYIDNAVDAHIQAFNQLEFGSNLCGQTYFIGQELPVNLWNFIGDILTEGNIAPIKSRISAKAAFNIGATLEKIYSFFGIKSEPPMTRFVAMQLSKSHYFNHKKAIDHFGYHPKINTKEAISRTMRT